MLYRATNPPTGGVTLFQPRSGAAVEPNRVVRYTPQKVNSTSRTLSFHFIHFYAEQRAATCPIGSTRRRRKTLDLFEVPVAIWCVSLNIWSEMKTRLHSIYYNLMWEDRWR